MMIFLFAVLMLCCIDYIFSVKKASFESEVNMLADKISQLLVYWRGTSRGSMPQLELADGTTVSVQAGEYLYCSPRDNEGPYTEVELGFPSRRFEEFMPYADDADSPTGTVYAYVPLSLVARAFLKRGGIANHL